MSAAASIHTHKPWLKSTGPRTTVGKSISRMNALKHGQRSAAVIAERRAVKHYLRVQREFLKQIRLLLRYQRAGVSKDIIQKATNELIRPACHPERSEGSLIILTTQIAQLHSG